MSRITEQIHINTRVVHNRILMPALVCFNWANDDGFAIVNRARHYGKRAKGGTGIIVVEATAVHKEGRLCASELGLWNDEHIPQFAEIVQACKSEKSLVLVQLVHAGMYAVSKNIFSASTCDVKGRECLEMTLEQIYVVKDDFIKASVRAYKAGLDGVEIHGAHGYLLNQFASKHTNKRDDLYGGNLEGRMRLSLEIVAEVRKATSEDFIIAYRYGVNDNTFAEDRLFAKKLEAEGVDLLDVSAGIALNDVEIPADFKFEMITYLGTQMKGHVTIPVASVCGIRTPEQAAFLLENELTDIVAVGRGLLADPDWTNKAITHQDVDVCYHCNPRCKFGINGHTCPWNIKRKGNGQTERQLF